MTGNGRDWKYNLFKKRYPSWIYILVLIIFALVIYLWIRNLAGV